LTLAPILSEFVGRAPAAEAREQVGPADEAVAETILSRLAVHRVELKDEERVAARDRSNEDDGCTYALVFVRHFTRPLALEVDAVTDLLIPS
jgi:hypothetical protein